jgi:sarcosine oxidase subunit alpha
VNLQGRSPLETAAVERGARFTETGDWRIAVSFGAPDREAEAARTSLALIDMSARGKLEILGAEAEQYLRDRLGSPTLEVGSGQAVPWGHLYRLRQDLYIGTTPGAAAELVHELQTGARRAEHFVTVTEITHGRSELWLVGPQSRSVMAKVCGLDLQPSAFPDGTAAFASIAKTSQLILRRDVAGLLCFVLVGPRSLGDYLWRVLEEAGAEWQLVTAGTQALGILEAHRQPGDGYHELE